MENSDEFDFESFKREAIKGMYSGKGFSGEKGIFAPLMKHFLEAALRGEMSAHLQESQLNGEQNRRNGKATKRVKGLGGEFELESGRDRLGTFEPMILPKRQVIIPDELQDHVIEMYSVGISTRDISAHIKKMYHFEISPTQLSAITDSVLPAMNEWKIRPLQSVYPFVFMDCMHYKVRDEGRVTTRAIYNILGIDLSGRKELIGMYVSESEGAKFWLNVITDLKSRGVEDIFIASIDGLKGFPEAIAAVFPKTQVQSCIVHQIRNSLRYVAEKDKKAFVADLKPVYKALNAEEGYGNLVALEQKWGTKYPVPIQSWFNNWDRLSTFFEFDPDIRKVIYTTNPIEGFHRQVRKVTKTKGAFTSDQALMKLVYLVVQKIADKWTMPLQNWSLTLSQLYITFGDRLKIHLAS